MRTHLGYRKVEVKLAKPSQPGRYQQADLLVDRGAMYTVVNAKKLRDLGIKSVDKMDFYSINN